MNQIYKKENFVVIPIGNNYIVINSKKKFEDEHTHVKSIGYAKLLIYLAIKKELPKNPKLVDSLVRLSQDEKYIKKLKEFKEDDGYIRIEEMMKHVSYKRVHGFIKRR